jgi:F-type H+-transporting ATPase subunit gamma
MASIRDIKRRRDSISSTEQITKAMKLISTVKLQKSKAKTEESKPYYGMMFDTVGSMLRKSGSMEHKYLRSGNSKRKTVIVITSNRGLAGGYNNNIAKLVRGDERLVPELTDVYAIGRKGKEALVRRGYAIAADYSEVINEPLYRDAADITVELLDAFGQNRTGEIYLAYTSFKNTVTQIPTLKKLLPVEMKKESEKTDLTLMNYEPDEDQVLDSIIPKYMSSMIYGALLEAVASENGARMAAMDSATNNAEEMIEELGLAYNRARQGSITQELTEIIAGANAIS